MKESKKNIVQKKKSEKTAKSAKSNTPKSQNNQKSAIDFLTDTTTNVGNAERIVSAVGGGALVAYGIKRKDWVGALLGLIGGSLALRGATGHCQVYDALDVDTREKSLLDLGKKQAQNWFGQETEIVKTVTINKSADELFGFWRNFENLPKFMDHLETVKVTDEKRSEWTAKAPLGSEVSWNAVITEETPNEMIAWTSFGDSDVENSGKVEFKPTVNRGTEVKVTIRYQPPAGKIGAVAAYFLEEEPNTQVEEDLRRFKSLMETGLIMQIEGQPSGRAQTKTATA